MLHNILVLSVAECNPTQHYNKFNFEIYLNLESQLRCVLTQMVIRFDFVTVHLHLNCLPRVVWLACTVRSCIASLFCQAWVECNYFSYCKGASKALIVCRGLSPKYVRGSLDRVDSCKLKSAIQVEQCTLSLLPSLPIAVNSAVARRGVME